MKKYLKRIIKIIAIIMAVIILGFTAIYIYAYLDEKKSNEYAEKYEAQYKQSENPVDLLNVCYYLSETKNNSKLEEYLKKSIDLVTVEAINQSEFSESYNESGFKSPKIFMINMYITVLFMEQKYDLYIQEYAFYYTEAYSNLEGNNLMELERIAMPLFVTLKDPKIIESEIKAYEQIIESTDNVNLQNTCKTHIDLLTEFLEKVNKKESELNSAA